MDESVAAAAALSSDPFESDWLEGLPVTTEQAAGWFAPGATFTSLGHYDLEVRERRCNLTTGCTAWERRNADYVGPGRIDANVSDSGEIQPRLVSAICERATLASVYGSTCRGLASGTLDCGSYDYVRQPGCFFQRASLGNSRLRFAGKVTREGLWLKGKTSTEVERRARAEIDWVEQESVASGRFLKSPPSSDWFFDPYSGGAVLRSHAPAPWDEARQTCTAMGGRLTTVDDWGMFARGGLTFAERPWTDARRVTGGDHDETYGFSNGRGKAEWLMRSRGHWASGEPNNAGGGENCVEILPWGEWGKDWAYLNDLSCTSPRPYGCVVN